MITWDIVQNKMQEIIANEDKTEPLSDDAIMKTLDQAGITVARRMVTRCRQKLNIPSWRGRRDWSKREK